MATKIFVNLAVKDLDKSKEFFTKIGFTINPQFTNDKAACVVIRTMWSKMVQKFC